MSSCSKLKIFSSGMLGLSWGVSLFGLPMHFFFFLILIDVIVVISAFFVFWWIVCLFILESNFNRDKKINILVSVVIFFDICRQNQ